MRRALDALYDAGVWLAALMMVGVLAMVLTSIAGRQLHFHVPGTDAYAGYLMAGAGFLSLAHTLKRGEHIRVTLLLQALRGTPRRALELWSLTVATLLAAAFAFYSIKLAWQSHVFHDVSTSTTTCRRRTTRRRCGSRRSRWRSARCCSRSRCSTSG